MVVVEARALGRKKPLIPEWSVPLPPELGPRRDDGVTLRQLIEHVVRNEVAAFAERQQARQFVRALSEREIAEGAEKGRVDPGGREPSYVPEPEIAVGTALEAFEDGLYLVLVDEQEKKNLDEAVFVRDDSKVVFVRLTFLAGW